MWERYLVRQQGSQSHWTCPPPPTLSWGSGRAVARLGSPRLASFLFASEAAWSQSDPGRPHQKPPLPWQMQSVEGTHQWRTRNEETGWAGQAFLILWGVCSVMSDCLRPHGLSPPGSSDHGISQARILEQAAISYPRVTSWPKDQNSVSCISCISRWTLHHWATREARSLRGNHNSTHPLFIQAPFLR